MERGLNSDPGPEVQCSTPGLADEDLRGTRGADPEPARVPRPTDRLNRSLALNLLRLARPHQWVKSAFVLIGPMYAVATGDKVLSLGVVIQAAAAVIAFALASSSCYVVNDIRDVEADRHHPRKKKRPIASGAVPIPTAWTFAAVLALGAAAATLLALIEVAPEVGLTIGGPGAWERVCWLALAAGIYVVNTTAYSMALKHEVVLDVISLAAGFVLRVLAGCAATAVVPSSWLLNVTFFVAMFLAFGKRLGERRAMGNGGAESARAVQNVYTDELLRMAVVVTGVVVLVTYAGYVQDQGRRYVRGFNLLWLTMLPATYGLLRCIVLLERGKYDDPTEMAVHDRPIQFAVLLFGAITVGVMGILHPEG